MDRVIDKTPDRIAGMFNAIAWRYDAVNRLISAGFDRRWRRKAVRSLSLTGTETVLDLCTGTADVAIALSRGVPAAGRVVGVDFAAEMIRCGVRKLETMRLSRQVPLLRADATQVPLPAASVDAATIAFGIRNVEDPSRALSELHRVVRPGGRIAILEFGLPEVLGIRGIYAWYFGRVLPWLGRLASGHDSAYSYLPASVGEFPSGTSFCRLMDDAGFVQTRANGLQLGIVYLYEAVRPL